jgi:hypothetical protein
MVNVQKLALEAKMTDNRKWCWREKNSEIAHGPFDSKEETIEEAKAHLSSCNIPIDVMIGRCDYAYAPNYIPDDLDFIQEQMEERAYDDSFSFWDDEVFDVKEGAQEALTKLLKEWAKEYFSSSVWCCGSEERVELEFKKDSE